VKIIGVVPARMASRRFPGKPLYPICGRAMIDHVFSRARMFPAWDGLYLATCDREIFEFGRLKGWPVLMTSSAHVRCLDRVAEAVDICGLEVDEHDIVICVQGDEPLVTADMVEATIRPLREQVEALCTVLAVEIVEEEQFRNKDVVKIVHDHKGDVIYTSREPIPHCETLTVEVGARRVGGLFAFRSHFLKMFTQLPESHLERIESCDSNRLLEHGYKQKIAPYPHCPYFSVDSPSDIALVEKALLEDPLLGLY